MNEPFIIEALFIKKFKKLTDRTFDLTKETNVFFGGIACGKTSVAEFVVFLLYGADSVFLPMRDSEDFSGSMRVKKGEKTYLLTRELTSGKETVSLTDENQNEAETDLTPGEFLTGLDRDSFDLLAFFEPGRSSGPLAGDGISLPKRLAALKPETEKLYRENESLEKQLQALRNEKKNGQLDLTEEKKAGYQNLLDQKPELEKQKKECEETIRKIESKLDENEKRIVILKADLAGFADDRIILENRENAQEMKKELAEKEKKLKLLNFELTGKIGKLSPAELNQLKDRYNTLSLAITELADARNRMTQTEENLSYHKSLFSGNEPLESYREAKKEIGQKLFLKRLLLVVGVVMLFSAAAAGVLLSVYGQGLALALTSAGSLTLVGVACYFLSTVFSSSVKKILAEYEKEDLPSFLHTCALMEAHKTCEELYRDEAKRAGEICEEKAVRAQQAENAISRTISALGYTEEDGEVLAICDEIIEANEEYFDLESEIKSGKEQYEALLRKNVDRETAEFSEGFVAMQKELDFLNRQNESLTRQRSALFEQIEKIRSLLPDEAAIQKEIALLSEKEEELQKRFRSLQIDRTLTATRIAEFEKALRLMLEKKINERLAFRLKGDDQYLFDDHFELCYSENGNLLHFSASAGGLGELGYLALRLSLADLLQPQNGLFIFDDPFALLDASTAADLSRAMLGLRGQTLITTSSNRVLETMGENARVFRL